MIQLWISSCCDLKSKHMCQIFGKTDFYNKITVCKQWTKYKEMHINLKTQRLETSS